MPAWPARCLVVLVAVTALAACSRHRGGTASLPAGALALAFETRVEIDIGATNVAAAVLADFDGDRDLDVAATTLSGTLAILLTQNGVLTRAQELPIPGFAFNVKGADVDGNGSVDLIVLRTAAERLTVFTNDGAGQFAWRDEVPVPADGSSLAVGELSGDGFADVAVAHWHPQHTAVVAEVSLYQGRGDGTFEPARRVLAMPNGAIAGGLATHDVDGDGRLDLLATEKYGDRVVAFRQRVGGGHEVFATAAVGNCPSSIAVGDLDGDGIAELAVTNYGDRSVSVLAVTVGGFGAVQTVRLSGLPGRAVIGDVTGDGIGDLVVGSVDRAFLGVFPGQAGRPLRAEIALAASGVPFQPVIGDLTGDGRDDLLATAAGTSLLNLFIGAPGGPIGAAHVETGVAEAGGVAVADFNGDGRAEIAVANTAGSQIAILGLPLGQSDLRLVVPLLALIDIGQRLLGVVAEDFDRDGRADLAVATAVGVKLLRNTTTLGTVNFDFQPTPADPNQMIVPGVGPFGIAAADLDSDGRGDLVVSDAFADSVAVARSNGTGYELVTSPLQLGGRPGGLAVGDFTSDGRPDVAVARNATATITILANDGSGRLTPWSEQPVGPLPSYLLAADFDRDGRLDLASSDSGGGGISVLLARVGGFVMQLLPAAAATPTALVARDLDRDGSVDLLAVTLSAGDFRVYAGNGAGDFGAPRRFPGTYKSSSAGLGDVDGDGRADLVVASIGSGRISIYRNLSQPRT